MNAVVEMPAADAPNDEKPDPNMLALDREDAEAIIDSLLVGLSSFGEVERVRDLFGVYCSVGHDLPKDLMPLHPTGTSDTIAQFANALRLLTLAMNRY